MCVCVQVLFVKVCLSGCGVCYSVRVSVCVSVCVFAILITQPSRNLSSGTAGTWMVQLLTNIIFGTSRQLTKAASSLVDIIPLRLRHLAVGGGRGWGRGQI